MSERPEVILRPIILRPTVKAHLPEEVAEATELLLRELYERHMADGVLQGTSFLLVRARAACEELEMVLAAVEEVHDTAEASSLNAKENRVAGRVAEVLPALRQAVETLRGAFGDDE